MPFDDGLYVVSRDLGPETLMARGLPVVSRLAGSGVPFGRVDRALGTGIPGLGPHQGLRGRRDRLVPGTNISRLPI